MSGQHRDPTAAADDYNLTRPPAVAPEGQLAWEATETAPTEWVPYVYTEAEVRTVGIRRRLSIGSILFGILGVTGGVLGVFGLPFAIVAVVLALTARLTERRAGGLWRAGLFSGVAGLLLGAGWLYYITQVLIPAATVTGG